MNDEAALADLERLRRTKFRKRLFRVLCGISAIVLIFWGVSPWVSIGINGTKSVDGYLFLIVKNQPPVKGDLAAFWPPKNRFYNKKLWFVKYVVGAGGDRVSSDGRKFHINGQYVGTAKEFSKDGAELQPGITGVIPDGYYFMWTQHPDSFDSRYEDIGWISKDHIIGRAYRIL